MFSSFTQIILTLRVFPFIMFLLLLQTIDSELGKASISSLCDQSLMELIYQGLTKEAEDFQDIDGTYTDCCYWSGVLCDNNKNVTEVKWAEFEGEGDSILDGTLDTRLIPPSVTHFDVAENMLQGPLLLEEIPKNIKFFDVSENCFVRSVCFTKQPNFLLDLRLKFNKLSGIIHLSDLPRNIQIVMLNKNEFEGSLDLTNLPSSLTFLNCGRNNFSGSVDFQNLPPKLEELVLTGNQLHGSLDFNHLPKTIGRIYVNNNNFSGSFSVKQFPDSLDYIMAQNNKLTGVAIVPVNIQTLIQFSGNPLSSIVDADGNKVTHNAYL